MTQGCHRTQGDLRPSPRNDTEVRMNEKQSNPAAFNRYLNLWNYIKMRRPYKVAEERREAKGKVEKERYIHLNAEFQRIGRRDKKAFLSDQCKEREENNRMGKTRDLLKNIGATTGTFHAKMGTIKERNCMDLTEAEFNKKRW